MSSSRYARNMDDNYYESRSARRYNSATTQDVSYNELQRIRTRELESMQQAPRDVAFYAAERSRTQDDNVYGYGSNASQWRDRRGRSEDDYYDYRRTRRRESAPGYTGRDGASYRSRRRDYGAQDNDQQVARYQQPQQQEQQRQRQQQNQSQDTEEEDNEKTLFDSGADGMITAAAGAALGAITARHFAGPKDFSKESNTRRGKNIKNWKMIGGAVLGAAALNIAENQVKNYFEEKAERMEDMALGGEFMGEMVGAAAPDVL